MANNILNEGKEVLQKIYDEVINLKESEIKEKELAKSEDDYEKLLSDKEKSVAKEIADTTKTRREEIAKTFDVEEDKLNEIAKKTNQKRERYRDGKVSERIQTETADFIEANNQIRSDTKKLYKQNKTPRFFNSDIYYTLFMPSSLKDFLYCILTFAMLFVGIPAIVWYFLPKPVSTYMIGLIYVSCIFVFGGLYMLIFSASRTKYRDTINLGNNARHKIKNNKRVIAKISRNIRKDKDDSSYGLENYNARLEDIRLQLEDLSEKRKEALRLFDESTRLAVIEEIKNANQEEIDRCKARLAEISTNLSEIRDYIKQKKIYIAENYEVFLGKNFVQEEILKALIEISEKNPNVSVGEVIEIYKKEALKK